ncbi:MAG TPA: type I-U CRISPR-associated RAMP protein Csb1/Cas7u [Bryobacteraceae bacterium]|nr:type I-U CRISPR-associated RAMP protein Csb1/Cas7u [Bryobacteraceae bacterium]
MNANELYQKLLSSCTNGMSAVRTVIDLLPAEGDGGKVAPPTHEGGKYAFEDRVVDGRPDVKTVLLDSVQSQANRFEDLLLAAVYSKEVQIPLLRMEIPGHEPLTSLSVPHRVHDAIFRDSRINGTRFRDSAIGKAMVEARAWNATGMFRLCPTALLFGTWDSQSGAGVNSAKFARSLVSEIIALDVVPGVKTASRIDPLGIKAMPGAIFESKTEQWTLDKDKAQNKNGKPALFKSKGTPAEINHGNIPPSIGPGGVTFRIARQTSVLSFAQLRKLRFPVDGKDTPERNAAGRAVIAALGIYAVASQPEQGYQLRSRCQLIPTAKPEFEWIGSIASDTSKEQITSDVARDAFRQLYETAKAAGLGWEEKPITLTPEEKLVKLVQMSDQSTEVEE